MGIDQSAVASVLGIDTHFQDMRGGAVLNLPQRIAVIAQGGSSSVFSATKFQATSAGMVGAALGFGSPAHLIARQLLPVNGDGVGTIPVTIYPLADHASGVAATGTITPSGTQATAGSYRLSVNNILSDAFTLPAAVSVTDAIRLMMTAVNSVLEMPVTCTPTYGTVTSTAGTNTGNGTVTALSVPGGSTPVPGSWKFTCAATAANGGTFTLTDSNGTLVATVVLTAGVGATTVVTQGGIQFTVTDGTTDFAAGDSFTISVPATVLSLKTKWKGASANAVKLSLVGPSNGMTFAIVQPTGGLTNPAVDGALAQIGNVWETLVINALDIADTTALDAFATFGEGRWGQLTHKPLVVFTGNTGTTVAACTAVSATRRTDRVNAQLVSPGSNDIPFVVAARQLARIAKVANNNPPTGYGAQRCQGLTPGADGVQWDYLARDQAVKAGSSTVEVVDGVVQIADVVTFYRPTGEEPPAYRSVVDIIKLQNIIFNLELRFASADWKSAPLIPDGQATVNPNAKRPSMAKGVVNALIQSLADNAIISDPVLAKKATTAVINPQNPKRLDVGVTVKLAGNTDIVSVDLNFGFYFGGSAAA